MTDKAAPDFNNPNREPVISIMDLAHLDDEEMREGYSDGFEGLPCGDNRGRSYWHGWRNGSRDGKHRDGDLWDSLLARAVVSLGAVSELTGRVEACRKILRESGQMARGSAG